MADDDVVYVIADTHLGLREKGGKRSTDDPVTVASFLRWLAHFPEAGVTIPVLGSSGVEYRTLKRPTHLILLGDILELWDSENQTLLLSAASVLPALAELPAKVVYVLGNHDNILATSSGAYPIATSGMQMLPETFPPAAPDGTVRPLRIGAASYVFIHGHQLDRYFMASRGTWRWLGHIRQIGAAMGSYAWVFSALVLVTALSLFAVAPVAATWFLLAALALLVFPRAYMTIARPLYDLRGLRYRRTAARRSFQKWWSRFHGSVAGPERVTVVYGHTHVLDFFEEQGPGERPGSPGAKAEIQTELPEVTESDGHAVYNVSSWIAVAGGYETLTRGTAVYADADGPLFLGWDWNRAGPFHIPRAFVAVRPIRRLTESEANLARLMHWPEKLIKKWAETDEKTRTMRLIRGGRRRQSDAPSMREDASRPSR
jgi:UDP-2,3-diacylglucosamine pyrophosphatase LpxH